MPAISLLSPQIAVLLYIIIGCGLAPYVLKRIVDEKRQARRFLWMYASTFTIAAAFAAFTGGVVATRSLGTVAVIGGIAAAGTFFSWKAIRISQSHNALFGFWGGIIAMTLSFFILHEGRFITIPIGIGIVLSIVAQLGFAWRHRRKETLAFYGYVAAYSIAWGLAMFGQRYWSFHMMPVATFLLGWYAGALIVALVAFLLTSGGSSDREGAAVLTPKEIGAMFVLALLTVMSLGLASISYRLPQTLVQPLFAVAGMVLPALLGLFVFHERGELAPVDWAFLGLGALGALIVGVNLVSAAT